MCCNNLLAEREAGYIQGSTFTASLFRTNIPLSVSVLVPTAGTSYKGGCTVFMVRSPTVSMWEKKTRGQRERDKNI